MITVKVTTPTRLFGELEKQLPFAVAKTLTLLAKSVEKDLREELSSALDSASPYSTRGTFVIGANKQTLRAVVGLKDKAPAGGTAPSVLLREHFTGGSRGKKPFEVALSAIGAMPDGYRAMPGSGIKLDRYGNPNRAAVGEMLGSLRSRMKVAKGKGKRARLEGYFAILPGVRSHLPPGVYLAAGRMLRCMFVFVRSVGYRKRIDLEALASKTVARDADSIFKREIADALRTAR